jgi:hypothetical protein
MVETKHSLAEQLCIAFHALTEVFGLKVAVEISEIEERNSSKVECK